jgi:hypothetical protein
MVTNIVKMGCKEGLKNYASVWNFIDWLNIINVMVIVIIYFYCNTLVSGTNQIVDEFPTFDVSKPYNLTEFATVVRGPNAEETCMFQPEQCIGAYTTRLSHLLHQTERTLWGYWELKYFIAVFAFTSALKFFKAFRANPKLNVVTKTLIDSASDLAHFMIVFCALLMAFVLVGHLLFGGRLEEFSSPNEALNTCFLFLLCFAFDGLSADMFEHGGTLGLMWSWLFNLVMMVLLLNMILAIIFDVYTEVKTGAGEAPSLIQQTKDMIQASQDHKEKKKEFVDERRRKTRKSLKQSFVGDGSGRVLDFGAPNFNGEWQSLSDGHVVGIIEGDQISWPNRDAGCKVEIGGDECQFRHFTGQMLKGRITGNKITWSDGDIWIRCGTQEAADVQREERAEMNLSTLAAAVIAGKAEKQVVNTQKAGLIKDSVMWTENLLLDAFLYHDVHEAGPSRCG